MIRKRQACEGAPGGRVVLMHRLFSACSARWRSNFVDAITQLRLTSKVATLPSVRIPDQNRNWFSPFESHRRESSLYVHIPYRIRIT